MEKFESFGVSSTSLQETYDSKWFERFEKVTFEDYEKLTGQKMFERNRKMHFLRVTLKTRLLGTLSCLVLILPREKWIYSTLKKMF
jgi:hypothetical protein